MRTIAFILLCLSSGVFQAQDKYFESNFPKDWLGAYEGLMYIANSESGLTDSVKVEFLMEPTEQPNTWTYIMTYDSPKWGEIVKDYRIVKPDSLAKSTFWLDELDGIIIEENLIGNAFYSNFLVSDIQILTIMRLNKGYIDFELVSSPVGPSHSSQSEPDENGDIYYVVSKTPVATQFVRLYKK